MLREIWEELHLQGERRAEIENLLINPKYFLIRIAPLWDITQGVAVNPYRRFGITYRSHLKVSRILESPPLAA